MTAPRNGIVTLVWAGRWGECEYGAGRTSQTPGLQERSIRAESKSWHTKHEVNGNVTKLNGLKMGDRRWPGPAASR